MTTLSVADLVELAADPVAETGLPRIPCAAVILDRSVSRAEADAIAALARSQVVVGLVHGPVDPELLAALTVSLGPASRVTIDADLGPLRDGVEQNPRAATALAQVLRITEVVDAFWGVMSESLAYSMLLGGSEHGRWRAAHTRRGDGRIDTDPIRLVREDAVVTITLDRPERHNAFDAAVRDGLVEALAVAADPTIRRIVLRGAGRSFSSGGDLDEFGSARDLAAAHIVRVARSAGLAVDAIRDRVEAHLHGHCIGAGIEVPAFADRVLASADTRIRLPELGMGLIPGAGGTVSITKRIGRWRTAWLVLSGAELDARTAHSWGLVDAVGD